MKRHLLTPSAKDEDYVWRPYSCRFDLMNPEARERCFEEKGVNSFLEYGDRYASAVFDSFGKGSTDGA